MAEYTILQVKRDSTLNWYASNPRLALGEPGVDMDLHRFKIGNGIDRWNELPYMDDDLYKLLGKQEQKTADYVQDLLNKIAANKLDADQKYNALTSEVRNTSRILTERMTDVETEQQGFEEAVTRDFESTKAEVQEGLDEFNETRDWLNTRMDTIAGQTTEDTEILDARVDSSGEVHPNLGHNLRMLHSHIRNIAADLDDRFIQFQGLIKQFNALANAQLQSEVFSQQANEQRQQEIRQATQRIDDEVQARSEADEELQNRVQKLEEADEKKQAEFISLSEVVGLHEEIHRGLQAQADSLAKGTISNAVSVAETNERRKEDIQKIQLETETRAAHDEALRLDIQHETEDRETHDEVLKADTTKLVEASFIHSAAIAHEAEQRRLLSEAIKQAGSCTDWSKYNSLNIPEPRCAVVNFTGLSSMPTSKTVDTPAVMEFWDMQGNFFRKNIVCSAQGESSLRFVKKNVKVDLLNDDGSEFELKFGDWVPQDGFHLKAYYTDFFRGIAVTNYKFWDEVMEAKPHKTALIDFDGILPTANGTGNVSDLSLQLDTGALCHPDGFPCIVYLNGDFYGVFSWQLKKHRKNYHMDKSTVEHIHLDGNIYAQYFWNGTINWTQFEIRNPSKLFTMDGKEYDGDTPRELIDETSEYYNSGNKNHLRSAKVKKYIQDFVQSFVVFKNLYNDYRANPSNGTLEAVRAKYEELFDWQNQRDYLIFSDVIGNGDGSYGRNVQVTTYDGVRWFFNAYDLDLTYGGGVNGLGIGSPGTGHVTTSTSLPTYYIVLLYETELKARYKQLRDAGIIDVEHIVSKLENWIARIGQSNYVLEYERWPDSPCFVNYNDSADRVRKWLTVQIANMDNLYGYVSEADLSNTRMLNLEKSGGAVNEIHNSDALSLQYQINQLALAVLMNTMKHYQDREEFLTYISAMYQSLADSGNLTYMGATVASSNEIGNMLADVLSGTDSGEVYESEIPEELKDRVATSSEISEMLAELFPTH